MISEFPISVTPISGSCDCDIRETPISGAAISGKPVISQLARIQMLREHILVHTRTSGHIRCATGATTVLLQARMHCYDVEGTTQIETIIF